MSLNHFNNNSQPKMLTTIDSKALDTKKLQQIGFLLKDKIFLESPTSRKINPFHFLFIKGEEINCSELESFCKSISKQDDMVENLLKVRLLEKDSDKYLMTYPAASCEVSG